MTHRLTRNPRRPRTAHRVSAPSGWNLGDLRHFTAAIHAYVSGRGSIDVLRAFVKYGDPYAAAGHWPGILPSVFRRDPIEGEVLDVEATLDQYREAAATHAARRGAA